MRTFLVVSVASIAFATSAYAQSSFVDPASGATVLVDVYGQSRQSVTDISKLCGVDYAIQDPDINVQLEMRRSCAGGIDGGEGN